MTPSGRLLTVLATLAVLVQCSPAPPPHPAAPPAVPPSSSAATTAPAAAIVQPVTVAELDTTWQPGCPVAAEQLRRVDIGYLGFDGRPHRGQLIVHEDLVAEVIEIFEQLFRLGYRVDKMHTVERYPGADDELSMEDNNTSGFNCRLVPGTDDWSPHAYGRAIDLNPLVNPCLYASGLVEPYNAAAYLDRSRTDPGLLHSGDPAVRAFTDRGWRWGGDWRTPIDYQHFELP